MIYHLHYETTGARVWVANQADRQETKQMANGFMWFDVSAQEADVAAGGTVVQPRTAGPAGEAVTLQDPAGALVALWIPFPQAG